MKEEKKLIERNIELSTEFSRYLFEHPELEKEIPPGVEIVFLPDFDPELKKFNLKLGKKLEEDGFKVFYIRIAKLKPKFLSRIEEVNIHQF